MSTNFDLAPPAVTTAGITVVPVDIQTIDAHLTFDAATSTASGDANLTFEVGGTGGRPSFDLRQPITGVWLDGAPVPVGDVLTLGLGGGAGADMRVLDRDLASGSIHTLRLTYNLGLPTSSLAGSYPPGLTWSTGGRLVWNVGFTDLQPGRYLEAWVPANLIWDQYSITVDLNVTGTTTSHTLLTNGVATSVGPNHWTVTYPPASTALSPLLEIRPTDSLTSATSTVTLPVSGTVVTIEAWKLASNTTVSLPAQLTNLASWLSTNEAEIGPYAHGTRFVAFLHQGGMEYDGACTSGTGALRHEVFHSWWGRAVRPASQADGWFDEGWNTYHDAGGTGVAPFDFSDPPTTLCNRNRHSRVTPSGSYGGGAAVFNGVAALTSSAAVTSWMAQFYADHRDRPTTTLDLERHLLARSGQPDVVDAFHRFVYGLPDPAPAPDLWLRDDPGHTGSEHWAGRFWDSPDLWIRHADDGGTTHQVPIAGRDNWFHARVRNRGQGTARHYMVTFHVRPFAGVEFSWPGDFLPALTAAGGFDLAAGDSAVVTARWPASLVPGAGTHACWLAAALTRGDRPITGRRVWEHGNLAQKNLTVVRLRLGELIMLPFLAWGVGRPAGFELHRPEALLGLEAAILPRRPPTFRSWALRSARAVDSDEPRFDDTRRALFAPKETSRLTVPLPHGSAVLGLALRVPRDVEVGTRGVVDLLRRDEERRVVGGIAIEIEVID